MAVLETAEVKIEPQIEEGWREALQDEFSKEYFKHLKKFLKEEKAMGKKIYPLGKDIFAAFNLTPFDKVKVVLLGQDPYHGERQAHGLSFSVLDDVKAPPSLQNIFKELQEDLNIPIPKSGNLTKWAKQGVFLLNAILTVEAHKPASHQKKGWEEFTDAVIKTLSDKKKGLVFILWGKFAQSKAELIDTSKHYILQSTHPSPYSADRGFFGSKPFSKTNKILEKEGKKPIDWDLN
jgi:uracil-DNA glycosylase